MKQAKLGRYIFNNGTKDELMRSSFILYKGELAIEWDTGQMKVGDGVNYYKALPYLQVGPRGEKGDPITITKTGLDNNGNTVITFSDGTSTVIKKGERGQDGDLTLEDIKNKADLGADGKVVAEQMPQIGGRNLIRNSNDFTKLYGYGTTTLNITKDIIVPEWNAADATRVTSSGGTEDIKISSGTYPTEAVRHEPYVFSAYIKNVSDKPLTVRYNAFKPYTWTETVNPGESKRIVFKGNWRDMDDLKVSYFMFLSPAASDNVDFVIWRIKQEKGTVATDWTPAPEDFAPVNHTHATLPTAEQIESWDIATAMNSPNKRMAVYKTNYDANLLTEEWALISGENLPGNGFWYINTIHYTDTIKMQVAYDYKNPLNRIFVRTCNGTEWNAWTNGVQVVDNLINTSTTLPLSANQGKIIWDHIVANQANWNKDTVTTINGKTGAISKADITALGIPAQDTKYNVATTTTNGLMSAADKTKLDNVKEDVVLTQSDYDALSEVQKNDVTKKYWISEG